MQDELFFKLVENQIGGYHFNNRKLLVQAFTRSSYANENGGESNEQLEFIGDSVLSVAVVRYLINKYSNFEDKKSNITYLGMPSKANKSENFVCSLSESELSKLKMRLVNKISLANAIRDLGFSDYLLMGNGDVSNDINNEDSVLEDLFEAIIGAVYIDSNGDMNEIQNVVEIMLKPDSLLATDEFDYVSEIYDWDARINAVPWFAYDKVCEFDEPLKIKDEEVIEDSSRFSISPIYKVYEYRCILKIRNDLPTFAAREHSKAKARKKVCELAYHYLKEHNLLPTIKDEIDDPNPEDAIRQLEILSRRGYFELPDYKFSETTDKNGNPVWICNCSIENIDKNYTCRSSSKKSAKKECAFKMLCYVLSDEFED